MMARWIRGKLVLPDRILSEGLLELDGDQIAGVWDLAAGQPPRMVGFGLDLPDSFICPGFVDLHVHGGGGADFCDGTREAIETIAATHVRGGTTALLATTLSGPEEMILGVLRAARSVWAEGGTAAGPRLLGYHVEGPFLNQAQRGAQNPESLRLPDLAEIRRWLYAGGLPGRGGPVWQVTLAPELPGALEVVAELHRHGVIVSAGHTDATAAQMEAALAAGVTSITHLFNGMRGFHHREPGAAGAALACNAFGCELIADGIHVAPGAMQVAFAAKGVAGINLITDAMAAAGLGDGEYALGGLKVEVAGGAPRLPDGGLAGSALTMDRAVATMVRAVGLSLPQAVAMASLTPAAKAGAGSMLGSLAPGKRADFAILNQNLVCHMTLAGGRVIYEAAA